jgi:ribose 5-phosphate isomerase B
MIKREKTKIVIGSDHAGYELKEYLKEYLKNKKIEVIDFGCESTEPVDYPDIATPLAEHILDVLNEEAIASFEEKIEMEDHHFHHNYNNKDKGILICGSGAGMCITANKTSAIRAVNCYSVEIASLAVRHNDMNILCLGARFISQELAKEIVDTFMNTDFEGGRHLDRIRKMPEIY